MEYWPDIAHFLHIRPWELALLTLEEFERACTVIDAVRAAHDQA